MALVEAHLRVPNVSMLLFFYFYIITILTTVFYVVYFFLFLFLSWEVEKYAVCEGKSRSILEVSFLFLTKQINHCEH